VRGDGELLGLAVDSEAQHDVFAHGCYSTIGAETPATDALR
jgi:hypothetical protein